MKELLIFLLVLFFIESKVHIKNPNAKATKITIKKPYKNLIGSSNKIPIQIPIAEPIIKPRETEIHIPIEKLTNKDFQRQELFPKPISERIKKTSIIVPCFGGRVIGGFCRCPRGYKKYKGNCLNLFTDKEPSLKCQGGIVLGKRCKCLQKMKLINGRCVSIDTLHKKILLNLKNYFKNKD